MPQTTLDDAVIDGEIVAPVEEPIEGEVVDPEVAPTTATEVAKYEDPAPQAQGFLALRPGQSRLDDDQRAALAAIVNFDPDRTPTAAPHIKVFSHLCQARGLDPYAKEAYLMRRGEGNKESFTMQVGIDGYRKMAQRTSRFIRRVGIYWTGAQDADNPVNSPWWRWDAEEGAYDRAWVKTWLADEHPAAAKVVVEHYDESGNVVRTDGIANWKFYAPEYPAWEWGPQRGQKVYLTDADGKPVMEVGEMWAKGGPHMLAKCAEAQALRSAFPAQMSGIYTWEEMHRADQAERERQTEQAQERRRAAYLAAQRRGEKVAPEALTAEVVPPVTPMADPESDESVGPLIPVGPEAFAAPEQPMAQAVQEAVAEVQAAGGARPEDADYLRAEILAMAKVFDRTVTVFTKREEKIWGAPFADWTPERLLQAVQRYRPHVIKHMRDTGWGEPDAYDTVPDEDAIVNLAEVGYPTVG